MLADFLAQATRMRYAPGLRDCCLFPADWVLLKTGRDPAEAFRGRYSTEDECRALLDAEGGLEAVALTGAGAAGLVETTAPREGDIGVVRVWTRTGMLPVGAICTGRRWAVLSIGGLSTLPAQPLIAWRV